MTYVHFSPQAPTGARLLQEALSESHLPAPRLPSSLKVPPVTGAALSQNPFSALPGGHQSGALAAPRACGDLFGFPPKGASVIEGAVRGGGREGPRIQRGGKEGARGGQGRRWNRTCARRRTI